MTLCSRLTVTRSIVLFIFLFVNLALAGTLKERQSFQSDALDQKINYTIYLPDGYNSDERSYPVVYLLHGYGGDDADWVRYGDIGFTADRLMAKNAVPPMIIVMPDGGNSWYVNAEGEGSRYEDAVMELVEHVDKTYHTIPERASRAIGGLSMGGYGAAHLAFKHPDTFAAVTVMSGALYEGVPPESILPGLDRETLFEGTFGTPFSPQAWQANNPFTLVKQITPDEAPAVYLTVGDDDVFSFYEGTLRLYEALKQAEIPAELRITDGEHSWNVWSDAVEGALLFITGAFERYY